MTPEYSNRLLLKSGSLFTAAQNLRRCFLYKENHSLSERFSLYNYAAGKFADSVVFVYSGAGAASFPFRFYAKGSFVSQPSAGGYWSIAGWNAMMLRIMPESATMHSPVTPSAMRVHMP